MATQPVMGKPNFGMLGGLQRAPCSLHQALGQQMSEFETKHFGDPQFRPHPWSLTGAWISTSTNWQEFLSQWADPRVRTDEEAASLCTMCEDTFVLPRKVLGPFGRTGGAMRLKVFDFGTATF